MSPRITPLTAALALGLASPFVGAVPSLAVPITYTEEATASGTLDGTSFTNADVVLAMNNNTANVIPGPFPSDVQNIGTTSVTVARVGTDTFAFTNAVVCGSSAGAPGCGFYDLSARRDILFTLNAAFATYDLTTPIGPITDTSLFDNPGFSFPTLGGDLVLNSAAAVSTFTATTSTEAPEPSSLVLVGMALTGLGLAIRRRKLE